jgi:hypothetical protein
MARINSAGVSAAASMSSSSRISALSATDLEAREITPPPLEILALS